MMRIREGICISILGHIAIFSIFSFSFGNKIPQAGIANIYFWGESLAKSGFIGEGNFYEGNKTKALIRENSLLKNKAVTGPLLGNSVYLKPQMPLVFNQEKIPLFKSSEPGPAVSKKRESTIMFYPKLPYNFALYFKDREVAHIELMFGVFSGGERGSIAVKRKISSGNLEVDLLAIRYISRYLSIQQKVLAPNEWQTVKIDLSAKGH